MLTHASDDDILRVRKFLLMETDVNSMTREDASRVLKINSRTLWFKPPNYFWVGCD